MFASFLKKSFPPKQPIVERPNENLAPIEYEDEETNSRSILYYMPRDCMNTHKVFRPEEWSLDRFQIGRHVGKGKYSRL
jgi:hypothetical protein